MSCKECDAVQESDVVAAYRWKNANIVMSGCGKHLREVMESLNKVQSGEYTEAEGEGQKDE